MAGVLDALLEAFETPAQSQALGAQDVKAAQQRLAAGQAWNAQKHPRGQGGKFGYTTGGVRARKGRSGTRSSKAQQRTLGVGSSGALVKAIQKQLHIPADGKYGPQTRQAVTAFQRQHGIQVDGVVGRQTLAALRGHSSPQKVAPGPIGSSAATVKVHASQRQPRAAAKPKPPPAPAPLRLGGGVVV